MSEQSTVVAESSPAPVAPVMEVDRGPLVNLTSEQRAEFRKTGNLPEAPKKTEEAATSGTEETPASGAKSDDEAKTAGDAESPKTTQENQRQQPKPKPSAEDRIAQLESTIEKIRKGAGLDKTPKAESSTAPVEQPQAQQPQYTRPKPTVEDKDKDGNPKYATYEDFVEELSDWKAEQRWAAAQREQAQQAQAREFQAKLDAAKSRYKDFEEMIPKFNAMAAEASPVVRVMLNESEVLPDLLYTIASDPKELDSFRQMAKENPGKALRYIALTESLIREELESKAKPAAEKTPAKPQTNAPRPPSEVGGRATTPGDELESAAKANDFRAFKAEANRRALAKLKA